MTRSPRLLAPLFGATVTMLLAPAAWGSTPVSSESTSAASLRFDPEAPVETQQVGGEASVSTEGGLAASGSVGDGNLQGRLGIGAIRTISGLTGINARYFVLEKLSIGFNIGVGTWTYRENDPTTTDVCPGDGCVLEETRTVARLGTGVEALYFLQLGRPAGRLPFRADFGVGGRFTYFQGINAADIDDNLDDSTEFDIEIPAVVQLRFGEHFVLSPEFGLNFVIVPGSRENSDANQGTGKPDGALIGSDGTGPYNGPGFGFQITNGIGLFGGASLHYYF